MSKIVQDDIHHLKFNEIYKTYKFTKTNLPLRLSNTFMLQFDLNANFHYYHHCQTRSPNIIIEAIFGQRMIEIQGKYWSSRDLRERW